MKKRYVVFLICLAIGILYLNVISSQTVTSQTQASIGVISTVLSIFDDTDSVEKFVNDSVGFFANYTNVTGSAVLNASCIIRFDTGGGFVNPSVMSFNNVSGLYENFSSFSSAGSFQFNVTCNEPTHIGLQAVDGFLINSTVTVPDDGGGCNPGTPVCTAWSACNGTAQTRSCNNGCSTTQEQRVCFLGNCTVSVSQGWNFVSLCSQLSDYQVESVFAPINGSYEYILQWDEIGQEFELWSRLGQKDFTDLDPDKSQFIFYQGSTTAFNLSGPDYQALSKSLVQGWEAPIYPFTFESTVTGSQFYSVDFNYMLRWNGVFQEFDIYSPQAQSQGFTTIPPGEGFFIHSDGGQTLNFV